MDPVNKKFHEAFINLCSRIFGHLNQLTNVPKTKKPIRTADDSGNRMIDYIDVPDIMRIVDINYDFIAKLSELNQFKTSLTEDMTDIANNSVKSFNDTWIINNLIGQIIYELYSLFDDSFNFDIEGANLLYDRIENCFLNNEVIFSYKCLLSKFSSEVDLIELGTKIRIVKASESEWTFLFNVRESLGLSPFEYFRDLFFIETEGIRTKGEPFRTGEMRQVLEDVLTSLLLFKPGPVSLGATLEQPKYAFNFPSGIMFSGGLGAHRMAGAGEYHLEESEIEVFKKSYQHISENLVKSFLRRATERFKLAFHDYLPEEKLIDLMIAMECIYLPNIRTESSFRLGLRAAKLLSKIHGIEIEKVYDDLKMATRLRNSLVHGEDPRDQIRKIDRDHGDLKTFVSLIEDYTRKTLNIFFQNPEKRSDSFFKELELSVGG